ncbi:Uncharacterised protein [Mycoplasmopsis californica]|uniref:Lipoprotein n=1 Tax=Mycoplasmopsis equigenitalium TaxID=114883 RepID=A0ABY5J0L4_9BACT|nr:hypothetical protein [Mycoplasmopsis equigenitalium]UUD36796.1 hypothetical protein NPA09_02765 [Mycoplasmopsis equigenitalium]VEU69906.1 Uncharacterised protein [Mycoplasmopsis californica]
MSKKILLFSLAPVAILPAFGVISCDKGVSDKEIDFSTYESITGKKLSDTERAALEKEVLSASHHGGSLFEKPAGMSQEEFEKESKRVVIKTFNNALKKLNSSEQLILLTSLIAKDTDKETVLAELAKSFSDDKYKEEAKKITEVLSDITVETNEIFADSKFATELEKQGAEAFKKVAEDTKKTVFDAIDKTSSKEEVVKFIEDFASVGLKTILG